LDVLSGIVASIAVAVWSATTRTLSAFGFKPAVTLAAADVSGNLPVDLQTIKTQTVTCAAGVTISPYVGNATHVIVVDASGYVTFNNTTIATLTNAPPDSAGVTSLLGMTEVV
jgi:hypothetical protein